MKTLVLICSAGRSGSTFLDLMLGNSDNAFSLGEVNAWFRPYRKHHYTIDCLCSPDGQCDIWEKIKNFKQTEFHKKAFDALNVDFLIDSSKELTWVIDSNAWACQNKLNVVNILLYKDPASFVYSYWNRDMGIEYALKVYTNYYNRFIKTGIPFVSLNYNQFIEEPAKALERICKICNMQFFDNKINFWDKEHHHLFGSKGVREQLRKKEGCIFRKEVFSKEFNEALPKINAEIESHPILTDLITKIQDRSIFDMDNIQKHSGRKIHKSSWYYYQKLKQVYKKYFPDDWDDKV